MSANPNTYEYLRRGVETLVTRGTFRNGMEFRPTQGDALLAYHEFLNREDLTPEQKLKGFFEIPTGVGKTAAFLAILDEAHRVAREANDKLRVMIVVPTIPIMEQMRDEIAEWAPDYLNTVGFYGGDYRDIGEELTIIIYNSWDKMMERGEIDSSNIDILVSDEAHRGTSERRLTNMFNSFANGTAQIAFTATARFDEEKSVEQSHGHQIFSRGVGESVRLGELAAYIQTQLYVIRVQPQPDYETWEDGERDGLAERTGKKQEAWMRQMVAVMRDGRDEHTNDLLTDNKSGIYVQGTEMADRFAELASADPELQERARQKGCKEVVVSVHSKMHPSVQKARLEAFKRGEYLGLVSDEKLKEGFNDPSMKNIFDYQRGSVVDKAQIVGRAARKWWNEEKQRFEGATVIDTVVYIGSNDSKEDERLKAEAIRNAVLAWSVLEGPAVFDPKEERPQRAGVGGGGGVSAVLGLDVQSYINLDDVQAIYAYQRKLVEGVEPITMTQIKETVDSYRKENNGENPRTRMDPIKEGPLAGRISTWGALSQSMAYGYHGLYKDVAYLEWIETEKNPSLSVYLSYIGYALGNVTLKEIKDSIDAFRAANGKNPLRDTSGEIQHGPLAGKTSWLALSDVLTNGIRGLTEDKEYQEFIDKCKVGSLSRYLIYLGYANEVVQFSMSDIKASIDAYRTENNGKNPNRDKGIIEFGPLAHKASWLQVNAALIIGSNGLKKDSSYHDWIKTETKPALPTYLAHLQYTKKREEITALTLSDIKASIEDYVEANSGKTPSVGKREEVEHGPLSGKTNWQALSTSLREGFNGLPYDKDYQDWLKKENKPSLSTLLAHLGYIEKRTIENIALSDIKNMIDRYRLDNEGSNPAQGSGEIKQGVMKGKSWSAVDAALKKGGTGLSKDDDYNEWLKTEEKPSLAAYVAKLGYAKKIERLKNLKLSDIWKSITAYSQDNGGQYPLDNNIGVKHGPLAGKASWMALGGAIRSGGSGLSSDPEYQAWIMKESRPTFPKLCKKIDAERQGQSKKNVISHNSGPI